jgi:TetR/AcrR family transcriptional repressor of nem operon
MGYTTSGDHPNDSMSVNDRIIHATLTRISELGLGAVTMSGVADTAGVARQTLYNHYDDIDTIVATAIDRHNRESIDLLGVALQMAESPTGKIEQMVRHFVMVGSHAGHAFDFGTGLSADARVILDTYNNAVEQHVRGILEDGRRGGDFRPNIAPEIDTVLIRALLEGLYELAADIPGQASRIVTTGTRTILAALQ